MALTFITLCRIAGIPARWEERLCSGSGGRGLSRLGAVLRRPQGLDVCRLLLRCLHAGRARSRSSATIGSLDDGRMVANTPLKRPSTADAGFRSDPYDNQSGEMEADGVGLYGDDTVTTKEVLKFEEVE